MPLTPKEQKALGPYLQGDAPKANGEWDMACPLHEDHNRSASINVDKGVWSCYKGCGAGSVGQLMYMRDDWFPPPVGGRSSGGGGARRPTPSVMPTTAHVSGWASALVSNKAALKALREQRGLDLKTIERNNIGWVNKWEVDGSTIAHDCYAIPVYGEDLKILNVRFYQLNPGPDRRKIWSIPGLGSPDIYPVRVFKDHPDQVVISEGELDALLTIQHGVPAVTRTGGATTWNMAWNHHFKGKRVYIIQDCDEDGVKGTRKILRALQGIAASVVPVRLPYKIRQKHGKDLTDFFNDGYSKQDLLDLMEEADAKHAPDRPQDLDPADASIMETLDSATVGKAQRIVATVRGKMEPGYSIPRTVEMTCTTDRGENICKHCPLFGMQGKAQVDIAPNDPICLGLVDATKAQVTEAVREKFGALSCNRIRTETVAHQAVETLFVRPSVDHVRSTQGADFQSRKITSVGKHDTAPNTTVRITGALYPDPRRQKNEFLAWSVEEQETSVDKFELTPELAEELKVFQPRRGQSPLAKRVEVARELAREVTNIHERDEMHVAMDMVWHSAIAFNFDGAPVDRGWVELLIAGDTRTGKSEVLQRLTQHYQAGEIVDCKAASFAGVIGGLQQFGGSGEFSVNWGVVPMNDRRLVGLEEVSGLPVEDIAKMSSVRSSGRAQLTKIRSDETSARTRLIWLANPREGDMSSFLYGVDALRPLIGQPEDIARFTIAMCVKTGEVPLSVINGPSRRTGKLQYTSELCHSLVMWCWSRTREQINFTPSAVTAVYKAATRMGERYVEAPPLVQAANIRVKIASMAVALAGSTFSTDDTLENIVVTAKHVADAMKFMDHLYAMPAFGYLERSQESRKDDDRAKQSIKQAHAMLKANPGLIKFLRMQTRFKRQDIEEVLNYSREASNGVINQLHEMRMIKKTGGFVVVSPILHDVLRQEQ